MTRGVTRTTTLTSLHCTDHEHSRNITFFLECLENGKVSPQEMWTAAKEKATQQAQNKLEERKASVLLSSTSLCFLFFSFLFRINFAVVDVFDEKSNCPNVVQEVAVEIETSLRYAKSYFNRSTANRKELQTVGRAALPLRNTMALLISRDEEALAGSRCCGWVPTRQLSAEGKPRGEVHPADVGATRQRIQGHPGRYAYHLFVLTRMQTRNLSEWTVYLSR